MDRRTRHLEALVKQAEKQGATVTRNRAGGYRVRIEGGKVITLHGTPGDNRHWKNLRTKWVRHGLDWPWSTDAP